MKQFAKQFSIKREVPTSFEGIPLLFNVSAWFFANKEEREPHDIDNLWDLFEAAIEYADNKSNESKVSFASAYEKVIKQKHVRWNITIGLFFIRP